MAYETILYEKKERIVKITINRPNVLNALNRKAISELKAALGEANQDDEVRVVILTGAGRSFSTGHDLKEGSTGPEDLRKLHMQIWDLMFAIWDLGKPIIAQVNGHCLGIACDLAMVCDLTIAADVATFGEPEIRASSGSEFPFLPWVAGIKKGKELILTGDTISAAEADRIGMLNRVVPLNQLEAETGKLALKLSKVPALALRMNKTNINMAFEAMGMRVAMGQATESVSLLIATPTEERVKFKELVKEKGLKAALEWRELQFKENK
jgi:enoyl-CoA hydratase/carnithine racemase